MISLLCGISVAFTIFFFVKAKKEYDDELYCTATFIAFIVSMFFLFWVIKLCVSLGTEYALDEKIQMYSEENAKIEENVSAIVQNYMDFETSTYEKFKDEDALNLVSLFPELKSDSLVQDLLVVYVDNTNEIKKLKTKKIELSTVKWKLYFGR
jgi:hypothetical protein